MASSSPLARARCSSATTSARVLPLVVDHLGAGLGRGKVLTLGQREASKHQGGGEDGNSGQLLHDGSFATGLAWGWVAGLGLDSPSSMGSTLGIQPTGKHQQEW